jgi:hypothetical protein
MMEGSKMLAIYAIIGITVTWSLIINLITDRNAVVAVSLGSLLAVVVLAIVAGVQLILSWA